MKIRHLFLLSFFLLSCSPKKAEQKAVGIPIKTVSQTLFFCIAREGMQSEIPGFAQTSIGPLYETLGKLGQPPAGDLQIICPKWTGPNEMNKIVFAIPVAKEFAAPSPYYFWKSPAFKCAWTEYQGPMSGIQDAWMKLGGEVEAGGLKTTSAWREVYLHWVAADSAEDRTELQTGIE